ncbi:Gfo/Idh/MocA family protein [Clostridium sp. UBA1652]|uniref:Gfo/Idh/MocA family protein n=1 Tax=Clostridium sp. UBA1652 TaxID=1946348 RepID=UPI00257EA69F|nr:Gfo/Idh/MocA family oxidoreductase [Clostridium sp. UBA1652]
MDNIREKLEKATLPVMPKRMDYKIGVIGAGFIVRNCHLVAYRKAGFNPYAITSLNMEQSKEVAELHGIKKIYRDWRELVDDEEIEVIDIAVPPHVQLEIVKYICSKKHIKGILCQKPIAMSVEESREIVRIGKEAGIPIAVNSNMRYDQAMRALKYILDEGLIGKPVIASIDMRAIPDWQAFLKEYKKLEIYAMGVHHIDIFRYLFGDPEKITAICRTDPRTKYEHTDGIVQYTFKYDDGMMATSLDDVWAWPEEPCKKNNYINWRVEGTDGFAEGDIGWHKREPEFAGSTLRLACKGYPNQWVEPKWETQWFPDAFVGTMSNLLCAIENGTDPEISAEDNVKTLACVEACYKSIKEERTVYLSEILEGEK